MFDDNDNDDDDEYYAAQWTDLCTYPCTVATETVELPARFRPIIASEYFERLRGVSALSFLAYPYSGAGGVTRYDHSLTTARVVYVRLNTFGTTTTTTTTNPKLRFTYRLKILGVLAALLHDCGHGPFSHGFEQSTLDSALLPYDHASRSVTLAVRAMLGSIPQYLNMPPPMDQRNYYTPTDVGFVTDIIDRRRPTEKSQYTTAAGSLLELLSSSVDFDFDKLDYIRRDLRYSKLVYYDAPYVATISAWTAGGPQPDRRHPYWFADEDGNPEPSVELLWTIRKRLFRDFYCSSKAMAAEIAAVSALRLLDAYDGRLSKIGAGVAELLESTEASLFEVPPHDDGGGEPADLTMARRYIEILGAPDGSFASCKRRAAGVVVDLVVDGFVPAAGESIETAMEGLDAAFRSIFFRLPVDYLVKKMYELVGGADYEAVTAASQPTSAVVADGYPAIRISGPGPARYDDRIRVYDLFLMVTLKPDDDGGEPATGSVFRTRCVEFRDRALFQWLGSNGRSARRVIDRLPRVTAAAAAAAATTTATTTAATTTTNGGGAHTTTSC